MRRATSGINSIKLLAQKQNRKKKCMPKKSGFLRRVSFARSHIGIANARSSTFPLPMNVPCCHKTRLLPHFVFLAFGCCCSCWQMYLSAAGCSFAGYLYFYWKLVVLFHTFVAPCFLNLYHQLNAFLCLRELCLPSFDPRRSNYYAVDLVLFYVCLCECFVCLQLCTSFENGGLMKGWLLL